MVQSEQMEDPEIKLGEGANTSANKLHKTYSAVYCLVIVKKLGNVKLGIRLVSHSEVVVIAVVA